jgi:hypothetical protein
MAQNKEQICRLCTREVSDAIDLFSTERGVADRMATILELSLEKDDGLTAYVCQLCYARFNHLVRSLDVHRLQAKKSHEKLAKKAGIFVDETSDDPLEGSSPGVEDAKNPKKDPLVEAADMTSMDLGSLLSDLVAAKKRMREKSPPTERKVVTEDIRDLMNLLSGIRKEDVFVFGTFLGVPETRLRDIEYNFSDDHQRLLTEVVTAWINTCPETATWTNLVEALTEVGRRKTAQEVAEKRGIILPGVNDDGQLWKALKALIPIHEGGSDLLTLMDETEKLRKDVKTKDALLLQNEERLEEVNMQKVELEQQYNDTLQELEDQKMMPEEEKMKTQKVLRAKEAEPRKLRAERADKDVIENMEIEIMHLKKKVQQHQAQEKDLNLEKQLEGVRPEFEAERSQKMVKIRDELMNEEEEGQNGSPDIQATAEVVQAVNDPEPADLESLLSSLKIPSEEATTVTTFEDKPFVEEDQAFAGSLFQDVPPFLLSQILSLPMEQWVAIEASDPKNEERQRNKVLDEWRKSGSGAKWSVLVETLIELGLRGRAQSACIEKGVPLPEVNKNGPVWCSMKETLLKGSADVKQLFAEAERIRSEVKSMDEKICVKETQLEQARTEGELISANLKRAKQDLAKEVSQCKAQEMQINQMSLCLQVDETELQFQNGGNEPELEELKEKHRQHMNAIQKLWREQDEKKEEYEAHRSTFEPQQGQMVQMKEEFSGEREMFVAKLEAVYDLYTGREKPVPAAKEASKPVRPPPPRPTPRPAPAPVPKPPQPNPFTPGGYRTSAQLLPSMDPVVPTGYNIMDLFHPSNTFCLLPALDIVGRPLVASSNLFTSTSLKGRGSLAQECVFAAEIAAPWVVSLKIPNRGRVMVDDRRLISIKNTQYTVGDPAFEFIVRPYENKKITFESRKFAKSFLSVDQNAAVSVREMPPDSGEVQFVVRVQRFKGQYTTHIACPFGRPSIVNQLKDRSVIQLYCKTTGAYLGLRVSGDVVGMTNPDNDKTFLVYCDRGLGRVSLQSYTPPLLKIKMKFNGALTCQGEENLDNDFYLKEAPDGSVLFESAPNKGRYISITMRDKKTATIIRNFSINLLVFGEERGKKTTVTKYSLN